MTLTPDQQIKLLIGDLTVANVLLRHQLEQLQRPQVNEVPEAKQPEPLKGNGHAAVG